MKVAIFSESDIDDAVIRIFVDALLGGFTEPIRPRLTSRGWPSVRNLLPAVVKQLHYRSDAEALVIVVDSDGTTAHAPQHTGTGAAPDCRLCDLASVLAKARSELRPIAGREQLRVALGLAVPAIEAWLLCGIDPQCSEAGWQQSLHGVRHSAGHARNRILQLKAAAYGTDRAPRLDAAITAARRAAVDIQRLRSGFPGGFGPLADAITRWRPPEEGI